MRLQYHTDGFAYLRDGFTEVYGDTLANFALDYGQQLPAPDPSYSSYHYDDQTKIFVNVDSFGNAFPIPGQAYRPDLDAICANSSTICANQTTRETPPAATTTATTTGTMSVSSV